MKKYSFKNSNSISYLIDFCDEFKLVVTLHNHPGKARTKQYSYKTARGLARAEMALYEENPRCYAIGVWCDSQRASRERHAAYSRAYDRATENIPF